MEDYLDLTPYNYVANNPLKYIDPNGMNMWIPEVNKDGSVTYIAEAGDNSDTFQEQFGTTDEQTNEIFADNNLKTVSEENKSAASEFKDVGTSTKVKEGLIITGESVKNSTGSDVLSLDCSGEMFTPQRALDQLMFGLEYGERNNGGITDIHSFYSHAGKMQFYDTPLAIRSHGKNIPVMSFDITPKFVSGDYNQLSKKLGTTPNATDNNVYNKSIIFHYRVNRFQLVSIQVSNRHSNAAPDYLMKRK